MIVFLGFRWRSLLWGIVVFLFLVAVGFSNMTRTWVDALGLILFMPLSLSAYLLVFLEQKDNKSRYFWRWVIFLSMCGLSYTSEWFAVTAILTALIFISNPCRRSA